MNSTNSLNKFRIPMLAKFRGDAEQNTHGVLIEGDVYVITGYNPETNCVETTGLHSRIARMVDANAFEIVRNTAWSFKHGHTDIAQRFSDDLCNFEDPKQDSIIEALSFDPFMHVDLSNSPDYSATGRYIGNRWPELHEQVPARPLNADEYPELKLSEQQYGSLESRTAAFIHQSPQKETKRERFEREHAERLTLRRRGKSEFNHLFATGHVDALRAGAKERRFADFQHMMLSNEEFNSPTADAAEAIFKATVHMMGVHPRILSGSPVNCRCVVLDDTYAGPPIYASQLEDGKPTRTATFVRDVVEASDKLKKTLTARLERGLNEATMAAMGAPISDEYNQMVECRQSVGDFVKGCTYRAAVSLQSGMKVEHPHTAVPIPVDPRYFTETHPIPCSVDDREAPTQPRFEDEKSGSKDSSPEETTFTHKLTTRKAQDTHEDTDATANLRKYRYTPDVD